MSSLIIPDALALSENSRFPFSIALAYSLGVYFGMACGVMTAFTVGDVKKMEIFRNKKSKFFIFASDIFIITLIFSLLAMEMPVEHDSKSYRFFLMVKNNKFLAFAWIEAMFLFAYVSIFILLFDISLLFKKKTICK
ncbi:F0F1-type ATP synthase membrane subunit c/vacuolar-type H+-ATPase subunit K [Oxalobacteraceae bacterium GrIS 1.11]